MQRVDGVNALCSFLSFVQIGLWACFFKPRKQRLRLTGGGREKSYFRITNSKKRSSSCFFFLTVRFRMHCRPSVRRRNCLLKEFLPPFPPNLNAISIQRVFTLEVKSTVGKNLTYFGWNIFNPIRGALFVQG